MMPLRFALPGHADTQVLIQPTRFYNVKITTPNAAHNGVYRLPGYLLLRVLLNASKLMGTTYDVEVNDA